MKLTIRPAAREDILRQYRYYLEQTADAAAERFISAIQVAIESKYASVHESVFQKLSIIRP